MLRHGAFDAKENDFGIGNSDKSYEPARVRSILELLMPHVALSDLDEKRPIPPQRQPFVNMLRRFVREGKVSGTLVLKVMYGGEPGAVCKNIHRHEAGSDDDKQMQGEPLAWDLVVTSILWEHVCKMAEVLYLLVHSPKQTIVDDSSQHSHVMSMTPAQVQAKAKFVEILLQAKPMVGMHAVCTLQVANLQTCPYLDITIDLEAALDGTNGIRIRTHPRAVGMTDVLRKENYLPPGFAEAMVTCCHAREFILLIRSKQTRPGRQGSVFVVSRNLQVVVDEE